MEIKANEVQALREKTGVGILECKKALQESKGDVSKAIEILRERGIAKATKRADRVASQGLVIPYIHQGGALGVLLELNCETDFVARTDEFVNLAKEIAMHIAAAHPLYLKKEDVPDEDLEKEKSILSKQLKDSGKPDNIIEKIVTGKLDKFYSEVCLLEQPYIKDSSLTIENLIKNAIAKIGENIVIGKFSRFKVGEK